MKAYVFTDKALQRHAGQFVWLSLDVEKAQNAPYKKKYGADETIASPPVRASAAKRVIFMPEMVAASVPRDR